MFGSDYSSFFSSNELFDKSEEEEISTEAGISQSEESLKESKTGCFVKITSFNCLVPGLMREILNKNWEAVKYFFTYSNLLELLKESNMEIYDSMEKVNLKKNNHLVFKVSVNSKEDVKLLIQEMVKSKGACCPFTYAWTGKGKTDDVYEIKDNKERKSGKKLSNGGSLKEYRTYLKKLEKDEQEKEIEKTQARKF